MAAGRKKEIQATLGQFAFSVGHEVAEEIPASGADSATKSEHALRIGSQNTRKM